MWEPNRGGFIFSIFLTAIALGFVIILQDQDWVIVSGLIFIAAIISASFLGLEWLLMVIAWSHRERMDANAVTPFSKAAQLVRGLTPEQIAVLPSFEQMVRVGHVLTNAGVESFLITDRANIPYRFIIEYLQASSYTYLYPINRYSDKTPERLFAETFTAWCILRGFALPAVGPHSAQWVNGDSRASVAEMLGIELESI
jgi:hypothetical protein